MAYPKFLKLDSETQDKLRSYIVQELSNHNAERGPYLDELQVYQELYWAKPVPGSGDGPIKGGSNLIVPLIAISVTRLLALAAQRLSGGALSASDEHYLATIEKQDPLFPDFDWRRYPVDSGQPAPIA